MNGVPRFSNKLFLVMMVLMELFVMQELDVSAQGPYAPAARNPGSSAIYKDSSVFVAWAEGIELHRGWVNISDTTLSYNGSNKASFGEPELALGKASGISTEAVSLGDGGVVILTFDRPIVNGPGPDFAVFENSLTDAFLELAFVEVSTDGILFVRFPAVSLTPISPQISGFGSLDPTNLHNFAGKYRQGYGTPFDLNDLTDSTGIDLNNIRYVKIIDVIGNTDPVYASYDSKGNIVNDPWPTPFNVGGFDLDAVGIIHSGPTTSASSSINLGENREIAPLKVYPNPFTTSLTIQCEPGSRLIIFDISGQKVHEELTTGYVKQIPTLHLAPGPYLMKVTGKSNSWTMKIIKQLH